VWAFVLDGGEIVVHRFLRAVAGQLWFRGDGNRAADRPVSATNLVGRVVAVEMNGRERAIGGPLRRWRGRAKLDVSAVARRLTRICGRPART
jgi:hypothetical protein